MSSTAPELSEFRLEFPGNGLVHVVFDAPEDANGKSLVSVSASGGRCVVVVTAGEGYQGHPLVFDVAAAAAGCTATEE